MATNYGKWDTLYDSDEEKQKKKEVEQKEKSVRARKAQAEALQQSSNPMAGITGGPDGGPDMSGMSKEDFLETYSKAMNRGRPKQV